MPDLLAIIILCAIAFALLEEITGSRPRGGYRPMPTGESAPRTYRPNQPPAKPDA